jgi:hypothetical protein
LASKSRLLKILTNFNKKKVFFDFYLLFIDLDLKEIFVSSIYKFLTRDSNLKLILRNFLKITSGLLFDT